MRKGTAMSEPSKSLPALAAVHLAGAIDTLKQADEALGVAIEALASIPVEEQPAGLDSFEVIGIRATVGLFLELLGTVADGYRSPPCAAAIRKRIEERAEDERNPRGLERAALALKFTVAGLAEVLDAIDETGNGEGDALYGRLLAAHHVFTMFGATFDGALIGRHRRGGANGDFNLN